MTPKPSEAAVKSYVPGSWYAVLGDAVTLLLATEEKPRVPGLWSLVDEGAGFDAVLDQLLSAGLSGLTGFALVGHGIDTAAGQTTHALVRGEVRVTFETRQGPVTIDGSGASTWRELESDTSSGFDLVVAGEEHRDAPMSVTGGLLRASRVRVRLEQPEGPADVEGQLDLGVPGRAIPVAVVSRTAPPLPDTVRAGASSVTGAATSDDRVAVRLQLSSGERIEVDRPILFGRRPEAHGVRPGEEPRLVQLLSPLQEISATHLEIRPGTDADEGVAVATDLGSTNGTLMAQPGQGPETLREGTPVRLTPGAVLDLGDGLTIQILGH